MSNDTIAQRKSRIIERLYNERNEAIKRAETAESDLGAVLERERVELLEWATRVDEQFQLRKQAEAERDELREQLNRLAPGSPDNSIRIVSSESLGL